MHIQVNHIYVRVKNSLKMTAFSRNMYYLLINRNVA